MTQPPSWKSLILPTGLLIFLFTRIQTQWHGTFFKIQFVIIAAWSLYAWLDFITGGRISARFSGYKPPEVPDDFAEFCLRESVNPRLKIYLTHILGGGSPNDDELTEDQADPGIATEADALALCAAFNEADDEASSHIIPLLFNCKSLEAYQCLYWAGMPLIYRAALELRPRATEDHRGKLLDYARALVAFEHPPAAQLVQSLAQDPELIEEAGWFMVFSAINLEDSNSASFITALTNKLPQGGAGEFFLDWANQKSLSGDLKKHPFDSPQGVKQLQECLQNPDPDRYPLARSVVTAIPFIRDAAPLMTLASGHPDPFIRLEAAWAAAKLGEESGFQDLANYCLDWRTRARAVEYLTELDHPQLIPESINNPRDLAMGVIADWLAHPQELNEVPETLEIVDHRTIHWPPSAQTLPVTLLRWTLREDSGIAMTGSVTWCFFSQKFPQDKPLEAYAKHCQWEFDATRSSSGANPAELSLDKARDLLVTTNPGQDWAPTN